MPAWLMLIMKIGPLPKPRTPPRSDALEPSRASDAPGDPGHDAGTVTALKRSWIRGFMAFQLARYTRTVLLTVPE